MRIKLDENLPARLAHVLAAMEHDIDTVQQEGLAGFDDAQIWEAAQRARRFLITQDLDFSSVLQFTPGTHHGLLLVRLRDPERRALVRPFEGILQSEDVEAWKRCFVIATDRKIRVRHP